MKTHNRLNLMLSFSLFVQRSQRFKSFDFVSLLIMYNNTPDFSFYGLLLLSRRSFINPNDYGQFCYLFVLSRFDLYDFCKTIIDHDLSLIRGYVFKRMVVSFLSGGDIIPILTYML